VIRINQSLCTGCGICLSECPQNAISMGNGRACIDQQLCIACGDCIEVCPSKAIKEVPQLQKAVLLSESDIPSSDRSVGTSIISQTNKPEPDPVPIQIVEPEPISTEREPSGAVQSLAVLGGTLLASFVDTLLDRRQHNRELSTTRVNELYDAPEKQAPLDNTLNRGTGNRQGRRFRSGSGRGRGRRRTQRSGKGRNSRRRSPDR